MINATIFVSLFAEHQKRNATVLFGFKHNGQTAIRKVLNVRPS
ncbi:hypothetical protein AAULR_11630 [Lacticaseibacillus rhamnosus MTCC 5462]|nr:hypothetical protein AAULR_11630 [Lacticaseibacillus rhamnosus MTCC 5462]